MFRFVTAFDWCSGGYDLSDGSQNGRSCHRASTLKLWIAAWPRQRQGLRKFVSYGRQGLPILRIAAEVTAGQIIWIHTRISPGWSEKLEIYYSSFCQGGRLVAASCTDIVRNVTAHSITTG